MKKSKVTASNGTSHPYIERQPEISQGKPVIAGTRIKVSQVALETERLGWTPDQIIDAHPHLTLAQVHAALAYYYENQAKLDADMIAEEKLVAELRQQYPSKLATLHDR